MKINEKWSIPFKRVFNTSEININKKISVINYKKIVEENDNELKKINEGKINLTNPK